MYLNRTSELLVTGKAGPARSLALLNLNLNLNLPMGRAEWSESKIKIKSKRGSGRMQNMPEQLGIDWKVGSCLCELKSLLSTDRLLDNHAQQCNP